MFSALPGRGSGLQDIVPKKRDSQPPFNAEEMELGQIERRDFYIRQRLRPVAIVSAGECGDWCRANNTQRRVSRIGRVGG